MHDNQGLRKKERITDMTSKSKVLPVLYGFFVMGFCDVVGIATSYAKADFSLSETVSVRQPSR